MSKVIIITERCFYNGKMLHDPIILGACTDENIAERIISRRRKLIETEQISGPYESASAWIDNEDRYLKLMYKNKSSAMYIFSTKSYPLIES